MPTIFGRRVTIDLHFWEDADGFGMSEEELVVLALNTFRGSVSLTSDFYEAEVTEGGEEWQVQHGSRWG